MAPGSGGGEDYIEDGTTNHLLDSIGKIVHKEVKKEAARRGGGELAGLLSQASIWNESAYSTNTCQLVEDYYTKRLGGNSERYPCKKDAKGIDVDRFSVKEQAEYDNKKMKCSYGSNGKNEGACASFRRLHLCDKNMVKMDTNNYSKAKHDLLLDVCMAAKYEGDSLKHYSEKLNLTYTDSRSQLCTELARSFADIGDIVRGRDLYGGSKKEKEKREKLEENLQKIFKKIHSGLTNGAQTRYEGDEANDFFKLREDWWTANRETVWEAITCGAHGTYFHATCDINNEKGPSVAQKQCRCSDKPNTDQVPTYFDYVPQYLRWFQEWSEDFCRKKKHKLNDAIQKCRGEYQGADRYCDLNGYDCEKTKRGRNIYRWDYKCTGCFRSCSHFRTWIDNQKEQFLKQRNKYQTEISVGGSTSRSGNGGDRRSTTRQRRSAHGGSYDNGYEKKFYDELKAKYNDKGLYKFLEKLSDEEVCTKFREDEGIIDFKNVNSGKHSTGSTSVGDKNGDSGGDDSNKTFSHTKYCQACPLCGVKKQNGTWDRKDSMEDCPRINLYKPRDKEKGTTINFLYSGDEEKEIAEKLNKFCLTHSGNSVVGSSSARGNGAGRDKNGASDSQKLYQDWQCYQFEQLEKEKDGVDDPVYDQDVEHGGGLCILKKEKKGVEKTNSEKEPHEIQKTFNPFFYYWVVHMLKDSIHWRTKKLDKCINNSNESKACKNNNKCKDNCDCFEKWVKHKQQEWDAIKQHFKKQKGFDSEGHNDIHSVLNLHMTPDFVLEGVLNKDLLLKSLQEAYGNAKDIKHIEELLEKEKKREEEERAHGVVGVASGGEHNTTIDKLLNHELTDAQNCLKTHKEKCQDPQPQPASGLGRSDSPSSPDSPPQPPLADDTVHEDEDEEEDEDDEDVPEAEEEEEKAKVDGKGEAEEDSTEVTDGKEDPPAEGTDGAEGPKEASPSQNDVNVCDTVDKLFKDGTTLQAACPTKYGKTAPSSWKCIPTGNTSNEGAATGSGVNGGALQRAKRDLAPSSGKSDKNGAICIPPRRRKLYVGELTKWAEEATKSQSQNGESSGEAQPQSSSNTTVNAASTSTSQTSLLRQAFIESAAVETFFLWDRYKKEWMAQKLAELQRENGGILGPSLNGGSQLQLVNGGSVEQTPEQQLKRGTIPTYFLRQMFYTLADYKDILFSGSNDTSDSKGTSSSSSNDNLKHIVLEASGNTEEGKKDMRKIQEKLKTFFSNSGSKPNGTTPKDWWEKNGEHIWNGMVCALTYNTDSGGKEQPPEVDKQVRAQLWDDTNKKPQKPQYEYKTVELKDEEETSGAKTDPLNNPKLTQFVKLPPFFRWLHEWGSDFCVKRARMLGKIKDNCTEDGDGKLKQKYSEDGEQCDRRYTSNEVSADLDKPSCATPCRLYKKWIERKGKEFDKQKNAYKTELGSAKSNNAFSAILTKFNEAKDFLQKLGPCSKTNNESGEGPIKFDDQDETFKHTKHCAPCSNFKVNCKNGVCNGGPTKGEECKDKTTIDVNDIKKEGGLTEEIVMRVSDNNPNGNKFDGLEACQNAGIFKGFRKDQWKCGKFCGLHLCGLKNANGKNYDQIILVRALIKRWLEYFLDDYNKIKHRISHCTNNNEQSPCINACQKKCECVSKWIDQKKEEWKKIKNHYKTQNENGDDDMTSLVKNFLEPLLTQIAAANDKKKFYDKLDELEKSLGCNCPENSRKNDGNENDVINCMLTKLETKIKTCLSQTSDVVQASDKTQTTCDENLTPDVEDDEPEQLEEQTENKVAHPKICGEIDAQPEQQEDEGECKASQSPAEPEKKEEKKEEEKPKGDEEIVQPVPAPPPATPAVDPPQADQPFDPTILQTTIPFGVALALGSIAFLFLKKKTHAPLDLFSVINIPKGDYDIPTLKSKNRYIPYKSAQYKGKTYIYMEGDSSGDEDKYMFLSDTTDVTSSESEYEEMDINDIYVPHAPKYKTLIEVVLEPSGKLSGNTIPTSDKNTPSDTQNDIQNDDIPSSKITDNEWNTLKHDFISNMLQNQPNTEPNMLGYNVDNNTNPKTLHVSMDEKPFIMSIHDRNLYTGEEYNYDMSNNSGIYPSSSNRDSLSGTKDPYSGIDLINDSLSGNKHIDIYDELLKRKENELFGTNHVKQTSIHSVAKLTNSDPIHNQLELFHKWLDRHRDMCEQWENHHERLAKLKEEWENETHSGNTHPSGNTPPTSDNTPPTSDNTPPTSDIPSGNHVLNTDVSIQIHMDNPKPINQFTNMDTILEDLDKPFNEPYYYDMYDDDIYYDVNDDNDISTVDSNAMDVPSKVQIEMDINTKLVKEKYPIADVWDI